MPLVPGAPHIALRCPVSKEPGAFPRKSVSLRREAPLLPSCGGVAVTLSGSRGIASHFPRFFPIFFPNMTGNDGFFPQKAPARGGIRGSCPRGFGRPAGLPPRLAILPPRQAGFWMDGVAPKVFRVFPSQSIFVVWGAGRRIRVRVRGKFRNSRELI